MRHLIPKLTVTAWLTHRVVYATDVGNSRVVRIRVRALPVDYRAVNQPGLTRYAGEPKSPNPGLPIMPAATVSLVDSSIRIKLPVARLYV